MPELAVAAAAAVDVVAVDWRTDIPVAGEIDERHYRAKRPGLELAVASVVGGFGRFGEFEPSLQEASEELGHP